MTGAGQPRREQAHRCPAHGRRRLRALHRACAAGFIAPKGLISLAFSKIFLDLAAATH